MIGSVYIIFIFIFYIFSTHKHASLYTKDSRNLIPNLVYASCTNYLVYNNKDLFGKV